METLGKYYNLDNPWQEQGEYEIVQSMHEDLSRVLLFDLKVTNTIYSVDVLELDIKQTPIFKDFETAFKYALERIDSDLPSAEMRDLLHRCTGYLRRINNAEEMESNLDFLVPDANALYRLERLIDTAYAHYCLDGDEPIILSQGYLLTGMGIQSIRNAASKGEISLTKNEHYPGVTFIDDGSMDVVTWIKSRKGYRHKPNSLDTQSEDVVRVPFASDGTFFSPECRMTKGFQIGKRNGKGPMKQRYVSDYWQALKDLETMEKPHWRRPSKTTGVPGTVTGRTWGNVDRKTILKQL